MCRQPDEERNRFPPVDFGLGDLAIGQLGDDANPIGHTIQAIVMEGNQDAVAGGVYISLEIAIAESDRALERRHRILGPLTGTAAMGERNRPIMIKERVSRPVE